MLNLKYEINLNKTNTKFLKNTQLVLLYIFNQLIKQKPKLIILNSRSIVKTLMLSPFHYKVAKKNIKIPKQKIKIIISDIMFDEKIALFFIKNYISIINISYLSLLNCNLICRFKK
jgi:hypothetical protein